MKKIYLLFLFLSVSLFSFSQILFTDVTTSSGIAFNAETTESACWGDFDNDGDQDLLLTTNVQNHLMRNDGNDTFTDVSADVNLTEVVHNTGCAFTDFNNDGNLDIYIVSLNGEIDEDLLYVNSGIGGGFVFQRVLSLVSDITVSGGRNRGVSVLDFNRDGLLDIWVNSFFQDKLYRNNDSLSFTNVAASVGISENNIIEVANVPTDLNNDGWIDVFTGNRSSVPNSLYINNGNGTFTDLANTAGINATGLGMGVLSFDYDNDLDMDLYWTTWPHAEGESVPIQDFQPNTLYQNQGNLTFIDVTAATGTGDATGWGISANTADIDNDRFIDFFVSNGFSASSTQSVLLHNNGGTNFTDITNASFGNITWDARGVAFADYDNDGDMDVVLTGGSGVDTKLWRNDTNNSNNWVTFNLIGTNSNRLAIGARVEVSAGGETTVKEVSGGAGRGSFNSLPLEFGLSSANSVSSVVVRWPNGDREEFLNFAANQIHNIEEGTGNLLSLDENQLLAQIKIFPNPVSDVLNLNIATGNFLEAVQVYSALGQQILDLNFNNASNAVINTKELSPGIYFLRISTQTGIFTRKIIKN
ncbi:MAG: FG-GAP-like repeat-containing protein [Flavobacteriaceae bacterium]|nr:FG-GAP-like repeat-containing protein [Flavobacteriaceae bacterium]